MNGRAHAIALLPGLFTLAFLTKNCQCSGQNQVAGNPATNDLYLKGKSA